MQLIKGGVDRLELTATEAPGDLRQAALFLGALDDLYVKCAALAFLAQVPGEEEVNARSKLVAQSQAAATAERPRIERFHSGSLELILVAAVPLATAALELLSLALTNVEKLWTLPRRIKAANAKAEMEIAQAHAAKHEADQARAGVEAAVEEAKGGHGATVDFALVGRRQALADLAALLAERLLPEIDESLRALRDVSGGQLDVKAVPEDFARDWPTEPSSRPATAGDDASSATSW
ncbi:hypothetical protein [Streptomyces sp. NPDC001652]|uniref:hypothetical protein n=1 Tax=Streptomyces sp. NPDC001652 TaxID=3154393 RepID=UPI00333245CA